MNNLLKKLSDMRAISGFEYRISNELEKLFAGLADDIHTTALGSVIAVKRCGKPDAKRIMLAAHCDEIGLMVSSIDENGFVKFVNIGGIDTKVLPSSEVVIHGKEDVYGVIGSKPPHLLPREDMDKSLGIDALAIDIGYSHDDACKLVNIGDSITMLSPNSNLKNKQFSGKCLDDRAGVAAMVKCLEYLKKETLDADVYAVCTAQEETGLRGAKTAAYEVKADYAIAVDATHGITPDNSDNAFEIGGGTAIGIGPSLNRKMHKKLINLAEENKIKYQTEVMGGDTGTDAWAIQVSRCGVPTALLSIPLKYMHTTVETLSEKDVEATAKLMALFVKTIGQEGAAL